METWIIILVVVIGIVVRIASAAAKKSKQQNARNENSQGEAERPVAPPPRATTMSEIQKAFMMMSGEEPAKASVKPSYYSNTGTRVQNDDSLYEGSAGKRDDMSSSNLPEGMSAYEGSAYIRDGVGSLEGTSSLEGTNSLEGTATEGFEFHSPGSHVNKNPYASVDLTRFTSMKIGSEQVHTIASSKKRSTNPLKLFEGKNEFTKAVIYSEILSRHSR